MRIRHYRRAHERREREPGARAAPALLAHLVEEQRAAALATLRARLVKGTYKVDSLRLARHLLGMESD